MQRTSVQSSQEVELPECTKCGAPMWLTHIEPDEPDHDRRTFECQACGNSKTEIVKFR
jgi:DNA-directed RNA polymerase subunit RPC12/RpoP